MDPKVKVVGTMYWIGMNIGGATQAPSEHNSMIAMQIAGCRHYYSPPRSNCLRLRFSPSHYVHVINVSIELNCISRVASI